LVAGPDGAAKADADAVNRWRAEAGKTPIAGDAV